MSIKNLNVDQSRITELLKSCVENENVVGPIEKGSASTLEYICQQGGLEAKIHFFLKKDGTVTVHYGVGQNQALSEEIAKNYVAIAVGDQRKVVQLAIRNVEEANFNLLREFIVDELGSDLLEEKEANGYRLLSVRSRYSDKITYKYYDNGTLQVQGKPLYLWGQTTMFLAEFLSFEEVVNHQTSIHKVDVCPDQIRAELEGMMPNAYGFISETHRKILASAVTLKKIDIPLEDYSPFVHPALRGVEGFVKQLFLGKGIMIGKEGFQGLFQLNATKSAYLLLTDKRQDIGCTATCDALQSCYSFYKAQRHSLFHMEQETEMTRIITRKEEADELVVKSIGIIEDSYASIVN